MLKNALQTSLKKRHILMIAIGSAIGTGLFLASGQSIELTGPSIILAYLIGGIMMYIVIRALGEMSVYEPNIGSFSFYANKYLGNYAGFISGWNYWFNYIIVSMLELTASTIFLDYWHLNIPHWLSAFILLCIFVVINLFAVSIFGEFEFWLAGIKVVTILALIIFGIYLMFFSHQQFAANSNIRNLWEYGGFFGGGAFGFLSAFVIVVFSFGGTELVGIAAGETENPQKTIPLAINGIIFRILLFYVATLIIIMCIYPWNKIDANVSPFVDVFEKIGISKAAILMNIVVITAALSSLNSGIYGTGRMLYNLSVQNNAPKFFGKLGKNHVPSRAILFSLLCIFATVIINYIWPKDAFMLLIDIATVAAIINWITILVTQFAFRIKVGKSQLKYKIPLFPTSSIIAIVFFILIIVTMTQMPNMHKSILVAPIWIILLSIGFLLKRSLRSKP